MREWAIAKVDTLCGLCGRVIGRGEPVQLVSLPTMKRKRMRCESCAEEPAPDHIAEGQRTHLEACEIAARIAALRAPVHDGKALAVADV